MIVSLVLLALGFMFFIEGFPMEDQTFGMLFVGIGTIQMALAPIIFELRGKK